MPADDDVTLGELHRTLDRLERRVDSGQRATDDRITQIASQMVPHSLWAAEHKAIEDTVAEAKADMQAGFERVERASQERKGVLERKDAELAKEIAEVRKEVASDRVARERARPGNLANWLTGAGVLVALIALIVTLVATHGGH